MILKRVNDLEKLTALIPAIALQNSQKAWNEFVILTTKYLTLSLKKVFIFVKLPTGSSLPPAFPP